MDIREAVKDALHESNLANPSKLYTPFTLFAVYFAIYFKADVLGKIFLSDDWNVTAKALDELKNPDLIAWFCFAGEVAAYSIGMLILYGIAQALSVLIWGISNQANIKIISIIDSDSYVKKSEYEKALNELQDANAKYRSLSKELDDSNNKSIELQKETIKSKEQERATLDSNRKQKDEIDRLNRLISTSQDKISQLEHNISVQPPIIKDLESENKLLKGNIKNIERIDDFLNSLIKETSNLNKDSKLRLSGYLIDVIEEILESDSEKHSINISDNYAESGKLAAILINLDAASVINTDNGYALSININDDVISTLRKYIMK